VSKTAPTAKLTARQERFVEEYLVDLNATQAAIRAGYSKHTAQEQSSRLLSKAIVATAVDARRLELEAETGITQQWVLDKLKENAERALQVEPVYDREGNETGEYTYNGAVANGALQLIGKHLGMFGDRLDLTSGGERLRTFTPDLGPLKGLLS
jgi:phage terminase small subunit